jgi:oligo-1,6-glucosidase
VNSADEPWWRRAVVYQVYPRSFSDSDGDGIGDIPGITSRLDHLVSLGVDAVWLSPVYVSPQVDNGYDIADYQAIDPTFGTLDDLDALIAAMHERGLRLVMDLVVNHTSDEHPWFVASRDPASPKRSWYFWRSGRPDPDGGPGATLPPNNWSSVFLESAWEQDAGGSYYLHSFTAKQPDLNWGEPQLREAIYSMMRWWLDRGVDGFRMDVINLISKPEGLPEPPGGPSIENQLAMVVGDPGLHGYLAEMRREVFDHYPDRTFLTVGEMLAVTPEQAVLVTDPDRRELDMVFQFEHVEVDHGQLGKYDPQPLDLRDLKASLARWQVALAERGWNSLYFNNHDQPRALSRWGDTDQYWRESATLLAGVLHMHRGTPFVYQGEEIGMTNYPFARIEEYRDIEAARAYEVATALGLPSQLILGAMAKMSRDNARTPMQWDGETHAGFTTGRPWLPVHLNHFWLNAADQVDDPDSVLSFYKRLIALRKSEDVLTNGSFTLLEPDHKQLWAFLRVDERDRLLVLANVSGEEIDVPDGDAFAGLDGGRLLLGNYSDGGAQRSLRPWELRAIYL